MDPDENGRRWSILKYIMKDSWPSFYAMMQLLIRISLNFGDMVE
jgi:hypothetical protein